MTNLEIMREQWLWNPNARRIWSWLIVVLGLVIAGVLYPFTGGMALGIGLALLGGASAIISLVYSPVGKRFQALKQSLADEPGDSAEAVVQIGNIQSPAIVFMRENELVIVPLVGKRLVVPFGEIRSVREGRSLYGKGFVFKRAFLIEAPQRSRRLGITVAPSVADRWRSRLRPAGRSHV